ncbi:hypothetical protein G7Y89_g14497 [Cudoniella acicularis]|uniref:Amidase domain-containing protein n=1 Tax=Cudoniella acicularis TaxID=354080 RepID=A0A8H4R3G0_9HELO|nr:hypothetical protein G7Y89_g14497 [Cudoniella acicularis]
MGSVLELFGTVILLGVTCILLNKFQNRRNRYKIMLQHGCEEPPRYPHKDPFFGIDLYLDTVENVKALRLLNGWKERYQMYGRTFGGMSIGRPSVYTVDARNLQTVHALNFNHYGVQPIRRAPTLPFLGEGVFTMDGPFWEHSRALIRPTFTKKNVANLPVFEVHFKKFLELLPQDGSTVDLKPLLYRLFFDTSTEFLFSESMNTLSVETPFQTQKFLDAFHYAQRGMGLRIQLRKLRIFYRDRKWTESIEVAHAFADRYVDKALEFRKRFLESQIDDPVAKDPLPHESDNGHRYVLLEEMAKETNNRIELRNQVIHVFLAGHDSSAITIGHAIFHLCRNPEKWDKLHAEVLAAGDKHFTFVSLKNLKYLQYVIKETLRLHPVAPTDSRIAYQDTFLPTGGGASGQANRLPSLCNASIYDLSPALERRATTPVELTKAYLARISEVNGHFNAIIQVNSDAFSIAKELGEEQDAKGRRGSLHSIPILLKDIMATTDSMETTAASMCLVGCQPTKEATLIQELRAAGVLILRKTNMSEWATFRTVSGGTVDKQWQQRLAWPLRALALRPITRSVAEIAYLLDVLVHESSPTTNNYASSFTGKDLSGLRIGVPSSSFPSPDDVPLIEFRRALKILQDSGVEIIENTDYARFDQFKQL